MEFNKLYTDNINAYVKTLSSMWCGEANNDSQKAYVKKLRKLIRSLFAPRNAVPVVQCMNMYKPVKDSEAEKAKALVGKLWTDTEHNPYQHQYDCWKALLEDKKSICVTTGTGSGKTECFMMPLVHDLATNNPKTGEIQAIFLYPLNALMEDQKERLEEMIAQAEATTNTKLYYAVYNGDLPEKEPKPDTQDEDEKETLRTIDQIRGIKRDEKGNIVEYKFKHVLATRKEVRTTPPNILLTNPTMLEYILLRKQDEKIITPHALQPGEKGSLRWMAIDETHTYTGAGAAELAMLLRRVLLAFSVEADDVRFATSSATFGNGTDPAEDEKKLKAFISGITGVNPNLIQPVGGKRLGEDEIDVSTEDGKRWKKIFDKDFVSLNELFPELNTVEEKLEAMDAMCNRVAKGMVMKAKVHYFYRVANNGLYIKLTEKPSEYADGTFTIYDQNAKEQNEKMLELCRCKHCGEFVAVARVNEKTREYDPLISDDNDIFDIPEDNDKSVHTSVIGLSNDANQKGDNLVKVRLLGDKLMPYKPKPGEWHMVVNTKCHCTYCNSKLTRNSQTEDDNITEEDLKRSSLQKFRLSADFVSRMLAPSVLDQLLKKNSSKGITMHDGQQYISFADSRQMAARATLHQNMEQERLWVYTTIYHALNKIACNAAKVKAAYYNYVAMSLNANLALKDRMDAMNKAANLEGQIVGHVSWQYIADEILYKDKYSRIFCEHFAKRSGDSDEMENGEVKDETVRKYIHSIMVSYLASRPSTAMAPETLGLFRPCYPKLEEIKQLPDAVEKFNKLFASTSENKIEDVKEWKNFLQIFIDYRVRSDQSVFLWLDKNTHKDDNIDIFACTRFATEKPHRRPAKKPELKNGELSQSRAVRYLCDLLAKEKGLTHNDVYNQYFTEITAVIDAMWEDLTKTTGLLEWSTHYDEDSKKEQVRDTKKANQQDPIRLNLANMHFCLYHDTYLCDTNTGGEVRHTKCLRPVEINFKGYSPYLMGAEPIKLDSNLYEEWTPFEYYNEWGEFVDAEKINNWAKNSRKLLWNNGLWGESGLFADRLELIHQRPNLFIQAEHTAQVDKSVARNLQNEFKDHNINILACSTTMEMGVDLGSLEVVMLTSVPPQPSNYKQRAGRSGRKEQVKSVCITLCGSDAIGLRTLQDPLAAIIDRPVQTPTVDLKSPQVVQRHVNSFLVRTFGVFADDFVDDDNATGGKKKKHTGGRLSQRVLDYYTKFHLDKEDGTNRLVIKDLNGDTKNPRHGLGDDSCGTKYERFNEKCAKPLTKELNAQLERLLKDTIFENEMRLVVNNARKENERCYGELCSKIDDYAKMWRDNTDPATGKALNDGLERKLNMQYKEVLCKRLLSYWATNRFTPNANMPVSVMELDLNSSGSRNSYTTKTASNPSYTMRDAISQYAPGNTIVVDDVVYTVGGIQLVNNYDSTNNFINMYYNDKDTVLDDATLPNKQKWNASGKESLELVRPVGFLPDVDGMSRIVENNRFTYVGAQLIGATPWQAKVTEPRLYSVRPNRDAGDAQIVYYNMGTGYGYCLCTMCYRSFVETGVAKDFDHPHRFLPRGMNNHEDDNKVTYHMAIGGTQVKKNKKKGPVKCAGSNLDKYIRRNVIIGGLLQTDYCEIRIRHKNQNQWISRRDDSTENLLTTLAIVFTQTLAEILGKERGALDFTLMPNGHICIFDTNMGGAGYANQLANDQTMKEVLKASEELLNKATSKDMLLDKFTMHYIRKIDIDAAKKWLIDEKSTRDVLPDSIKSVFPTATASHLVSLERAFAATNNNAVLFVNGDTDHWDFAGVECGWRSHLGNYFNKRPDKTKFCVLTSNETKISMPIVRMLLGITGGWANDVVSLQNPYAAYDIYPIAYVDGLLYFTNNEECSTLDDKWASNSLYCVKIADIASNAQTMDLTIDNSKTDIIWFKGNNDEYIDSKSLGAIVCDKAQTIVNQFLNHCASCNENLYITYQDEHLKSVVGMVLTLQTIEHFVKIINKDFTLEFLNEKYVDSGNSYNVTQNLPTSTARNQRLETITNKWLNDMLSNNNIKGEFVPITSKDRRQLTHWRVLTIKCGNKALSIYPDGGFANGWFLPKKDNPYFVSHRTYHVEDTDTRDDIRLIRGMELKFDVTIEDM